MALVRCKECGGSVSSSAKGCPTCGAPPPKKTSGATLFVAGIAAFVVLMLVFKPDGSALAPSAAPTTAPAIASASQKEAEYRAAREARAKAIQDECTTGIGQVMKTAREQAAADDLNMAAATLNHCAGISKDPVYVKLTTDIERGRAAKIARLEREEKARKKKEGVRVGMSKGDVLSSSWGKPQKVNATTTARGTREQWVYGGHNYLYFEGDTLTTIQN